MPWVVIEPSPRLTKLFPGFLGSLFGIIHGLTQRGFTGMIPFGANAPERDELNASAVAVALTLFVFRDQMREKNVGRPARMTWTFTCGFTPKAFPPAKAQFESGVALERKFTVTVGAAAFPQPVSFRHRRGDLCSRGAGSGPIAGRVLRFSRLSAEGEHPRGPEGSRIGGTLSFLSC